MSPRPLLPLEEALASLLEGVVPSLATEALPLANALGRTLAEDVIARLDLPRGDNSAMDGYAVRAADAGRSLPVTVTAAAGDAPQRLPDNEAARIFTGGLVPEGADAVVMQEDCERDGEAVRFPTAIRRGQHIRRRGEDTRAGSTLLSAGRRLRPQDLGLLASQGLASVAVYRPLRVALLSTGNELLEPGEALVPGAIYNSNRPMLAALLQSAGCEVVDLGIVEDSAAATREALLAGAKEDLILSSGGVSVGEADHVRDQVSALGEIDLWRIAIKPGKPFARGRVGETPFVGLPGNPASAFVTFLLLARPFITRLQGGTWSPPMPMRARAGFSVTRPGTRTEFLRVSLALRDGELWALPYETQSSGVLLSLCASDALAEVPRGGTVAEGDAVEVLPIDTLTGIC